MALQELKMMSLRRSCRTWACHSCRGKWERDGVAILAELIPGAVLTTVGCPLNGAKGKVIPRSAPCGYPQGPEGLNPMDRGAPHCLNLFKTLHESQTSHVLGDVWLGKYGIEALTLALVCNEIGQCLAQADGRCSVILYKM